MNTDKNPNPHPCHPRNPWLIFFLFALFVSLRLNAPAQLYPRIDIFLHCTNAATANAVYQAVTNRVGPLDQFNDGRNRDITLITNAAGNFSLQATWLFLDTNKAENVWAYVTNRAPTAQTEGRFTFHYCPVDGSPGTCDTTVRQLNWP